VSIIEKALEKLDLDPSPAAKPTKESDAHPQDTGANGITQAESDDGDQQQTIDLLRTESLEREAPTTDAAQRQDAAETTTGASVALASSVPVELAATLVPAASQIELDVPEVSLARIESALGQSSPPGTSDIPELTELQLGKLDIEFEDEQELPANGDLTTPAVTDSQALRRKVSAEIIVNIDHLKFLGLLTPESDATQLAEQMRVIKRPLLMAATGADRAPNANLIMVASALPNEGKTSTSVNLAISIAMERDRTVLLIDADVVKSDVSNTLGIEPGLGLTDVLYSPNVTLPDVMLRTNIPKLSVIPSGQRAPNLTELFAGEDMRDLMLDISRRYAERIIIIDSPPLLATSGASVLGSLVGQIVLVVEAVRTPQHAVVEALRMLGPLDNIGIVLNKARQKPTFYQGYGDGYDYYVKPT